MVPVSTANSLTARDSQNLHSYGDDRGANSPVAEVADVFKSTRQQYTPPAERFAEFADPDLTSDYEEFDSTFIAQPPPSLLLANAVGATQMDAFIQTFSSSNTANQSSSSKEQSASKTEKKINHGNVLSQKRGGGGVLQFIREKPTGLEKEKDIPRLPENQKKLYRNFRHFQFHSYTNISVINQRLYM